jgi:hypothetical protein
MGVFVADAAYERWDYFSVGQRPVGDGVGRVVASDQGAGHQKQDGGGGRGEGEAVEAWGEFQFVVGEFRHIFQKCNLTQSAPYFMRDAALQTT